MPDMKRREFITAASRNTRFQAVRLALPGSDLHRLIAPALPGAFPHSITSSAAVSSVGGTASRSAVAALRLITSSNLVGSRNGRSAGFAPLSTSRLDVGPVILSLGMQESDHRHRGLLRARRERPCSRATEQRDELAPFHLTEMHPIPSRTGSTSQDIESGTHPIGEPLGSRRTRPASLRARRVAGGPWRRARALPKGFPRRNAGKRTSRKAAYDRHFSGSGEVLCPVR